MLNSYSSFCDDFYLDMYVNTKLDLPTQRDTILAFFERLQKQYPSMANFYRRENNEYFLEELRNTDQYRWVSLEPDRIGSGIVNPQKFEDAYELDRLILDLIPYMLNVSYLDIDSIDITFAMDFDCDGNHNEVIAEALFGSTAFNCLLDIPGAHPVSMSPGMIIAISDDRRTQARINIESKTNFYESVKQKQMTNEPISLLFTVRQFSSASEKFDSLKAFEKLCHIAEELMPEKIIPNFALPIINVIAQKGLNSY